MGTPIGTEDRETSRNGRSAQVCIGQPVVILRGIGQRFLESVCLSCPPGGDTRWIQVDQGSGGGTCGNKGPKILNLSIQNPLMTLLKKL